MKICFSVTNSDQAGLACTQGVKRDESQNYHPAEPIMTKDRFLCIRGQIYQIFLAVLYHNGI